MPSKRISLSFEISNQANLIKVLDNGTGIPNDLIENIFTPFFSTKEKGSGIGLNLSRQIMRLHDGSISVVSKPGVHTEFSLQF